MAKKTRGSPEELAVLNSIMGHLRPAILLVEQHLHHGRLPAPLVEALAELGAAYRKAQRRSDIILSSRT